MIQLDSIKRDSSRGLWRYLSQNVVLSEDGTLIMEMIVVLVIRGDPDGMRIISGILPSSTHRSIVRGLTRKNSATSSYLKRSFFGR
jgi:hypothetical protein